MAIFIIECDRNGHRTTFTINYIFIIAYKLITGSREPKDYRGIATSLKTIRKCREPKDYQGSASGGVFTHHRHHHRVRQQCTSHQQELALDGTTAVAEQADASMAPHHYKRATICITT